MKCLFRVLRLIVKQRREQNLFVVQRLPIVNENEESNIIIFKQDVNSARDASVLQKQPQARATPAKNGAATTLICAGFRYVLMPQLRCARDSAMPLYIALPQSMFFFTPHVQPALLPCMTSCLTERVLLEYTAWGTRGTEQALRERNSFFCWSKLVHGTCNMLYFSHTLDDTAMWKLAMCSVPDDASTNITNRHQSTPQLTWISAHHKHQHCCPFTCCM